MQYKMLQFLPQVRRKRRIVYGVANFERLLENDIYRAINSMPYDILMYRDIPVWAAISESNLLDWMQ